MKYKTQKKIKYWKTRPVKTILKLTGIILLIWLIYKSKIWKWAISIAIIIFLAKISNKAEEWQV